MDESFASPAKRPKLELSSSDTDSIDDDTDEEGNTSGEQFGLKPPSLIKQLKNILEQYPDNGQIIKEIVQNAEDAGATVVKFLYDANSNETLFGHGKQELKGPALYSYNDGYFNDDDWKGIQMFGDSIKEKDPMKVGKFGLGFKSVFHLTDNPIIMCEKRIGVINPDKSLFSCGGKFSDLKDKSVKEEFLEHHKDKSSMYKDILKLNTTTGKCKGSLFRFGLRQFPSDLSETVYNKERLHDLLQSFQSEGHMTLIFLKNLQSIEFYERKEGCNDAELVCSFSAENLDRAAVGTFMKNVKSAQIGPSPPADLSLAYEVEIKSTHRTASSTFDESKSSYHVVHLYGGNLLQNEKELITRKEANNLGYMPLVGIAHLKETKKSWAGHIFCALPLPLLQEKTTGLPVHVNGFFALGADRKDLKWQPAGQVHCNDKQILWNQFLIERVLPEAYLSLFNELKRCSCSKEIVYNSLPDLNVVDQKWKKLSMNLLQAVFAEKSFLWTDACGGQWVGPQTACIANDAPAIGHETAFRCLLKCEIPLVRIPNHIREAALKLQCKMDKEMNPKVVREVVSRNKHILGQFQTEERLDLFCYMVQEPAEIRDLYQVPVFLLENDTFAAPVQHPLPREMIYLPNGVHSKDLLPGLEAKLLKTTVRQDVLRKVHIIATQGFCQLTVLSESKIADLLRDILPPSLCSNADFTILSQILQRNIPLSWFQKIWEYINEQKILSKLEGLPLIPLGEVSMSITDVKIAKVTSSSVLLYAPESTDENLVNLLSSLGFEIVKKLPAFVLQNDEIFEKYIHRCTPERMLPLLFNMAQKIGLQVLVNRFNICKNKTAKIELRNAFVQTLSSNNKIEERYVDILKMLSMFDNTINEELVSVESCSYWVAPQEMPSIRPFQKLLQCQDQKHRAFVSLLGARTLQKTELISFILLKELEEGKYKGQGLDAVMEYILPKVIKVGVLKNNIIERLKNIEFVQAEDCTRRKPSQFFDGEDSCLRKIFKDEAGRFPAGIYKNGSHHNALVRLGLKKEEDISAEDITNSIKTIPHMVDSQAAYTKASSIMDHLKKHQHLLQDSRLVACLDSSDWIPVVKERPKNYPASLTWFAEVNPQKSFSSPQLMQSDVHVNLVGSVKYVYDSRMQKSIKVILQERLVELPDVMHQLQCLVRDYSEELKNEFIIMLKEVYNYLKDKDAQSVLDHIRLIGLNEWVWNGFGFSSTSHIVANSTEQFLDLKPYVYGVPQEMIAFKDMLLRCGVFIGHTDELLLKVLEMIRDRHNCLSERAESVSKDLGICKQIIAILSNREHSETVRDSILIPIATSAGETLRLVEASKTVYSSCLQLSSEDIQSEMEEEIHCVHECITEDIAKAIGIRSITNKLIGAEDLGVFEEYGQSEPLTRRINRLLKDYGDGLAIVKELIQNADDAGATEVKLLYDERQNLDKQKLLIDPAMKEFQGPALWAYNNAAFSKEDFENIVKLSGATKEDKRGKIGRFGLGFNAVYNITDVPSFISNDQLVIFDPHLTNLGSAIKNKSKPGIKIPLGSKRSRLKLFEDQIKIYDGVFGMDASLRNNYEVFKGTLFRFPLRTKEQAIRSDIKQLVYNKEEIILLLQKFAEECNKLLLFTQNVKEVKFFHLGMELSDPREMQFLLGISKTTFTPNLEAKLLRSAPSNSVNIIEKSALLVDKAVAQSMQQRVFQPDHECTVVVVEQSASERAKKYLSLSNLQAKELWLLHSVIDFSNDCLQMAMNNPKLNPVSSVAVQISEKNDCQYQHQEIETSTKGYFFCFLPLPIPSGLPVHINGTFAVTSDRKTLQGASEDEKSGTNLETSWNHVLMSGPVKTAYLGTLEDLTRIASVREVDIWYKLWPSMTMNTTSNVGAYHETLVKAFYQGVMREEKRVFPDPRGVQWLTWSKIKIITPDITDEELREIMGDIAFGFSQSSIIVNVPEKVTKDIREAGFPQELDNKMIDFAKFFTTIFMPNIKRSELSVEQRDKILMHAIIDYSDDEEISSALRGNECIPTQPHGHLKLPSSLVHPSSKAAGLFEVEEEVFPTKIFHSRFSLFILEKLGMVSDKVSWELLLSRARTIQSLENQNRIDFAYERVKKLLCLVTEKMKSDQNGLSTARQTNMLQSTTVEQSLQNEWSVLKFLPVKKRPVSWGNLPWKGADRRCIFHAPVETFMCQFENWVGCHSYIIDEDKTGKLSDEVCKALGIRIEMTVDDIVTQVDLISSQEIDDWPMVGIQHIFQSIYLYLNRVLPGCENEIGQKLGHKPIILTDDCKLVRPDQVAFDQAYISPPCLYKLPVSLKTTFLNLLHVLNVKQKFSFDDYITALDTLKSIVGEANLTKDQLTLVRNLLESINNEAHAISSSIQLPDEKGILHPMEIVLVKEKVWMKSDPTKKYLHTTIPHQLALNLGAKTARSESITSQSRGIPFGQHEKLTVRLKRILEAYPAEMQILYELLQNADDAGANEVKFILDERNHPKERVFGDAWKALQGPALIVFNDAPFTEADLAGIQNLGEGSKSDDAQKTGQYGIGFNVVYHVTDVPCLLTSIDIGDTDSALCVFDPHTTFLDECSQAEPGRMFQDAREYLKEYFPHIHQTFLPNALKEEKSAIFRLPLRNAEMASISRIKEKPTTVGDVKRMFRMFQQEGPEAILFLRHVKSVALVDIDKTGKETEVFSVRAQTSSDAAPNALNLEINVLSKFISNDRINAPLSYIPHGHEIRLVDSQNRSSKWRVIQKCASVNRQGLPPILEEQYAAKRLPIFPMGGIACKMEEYGHAFDPGKVYCLLPLAVCSSLPVHINGKFILDYESRRRLWYSKDTFQTVWNYYVIERCIVPCYVELIRQLASEVRIDVRNKDCRDILRNTYPNAEGHKSQPCQHSKGTIHRPSRYVSHPRELVKYFSYFPRISSNDKAHEYDKDLIKMLFQQLAEQNVEVMPVLKLSSTMQPILEINFCPPNSPNKQFYLPYFQFKGTYFSQDEISNICDALITSRMNLYDVPSHIVHGFDECEGTHESDKIIQRLSPATVASFLKARTNDVLILPAPIENTILRDVNTVRSLLKYCSADENVDVEGLPLLLTDDGMLRIFESRRVVYYNDLPELCPTLRNISLHADTKQLLVKYKHEESGPVQMLTLEKLNEFLNQEIGDALQGKGEVQITESISCSNLLPREGWLKLFWNFVSRRYSANENRRRHQRTQEAPIPVQPPNEFIQPLAQWCLLPVERCHARGSRWEKSLSLIEISKASNVIHVADRMTDVAKAAGLLQPANHLIDDGYQRQTKDFVQKLIGTTEDPNSLLHALHYENARQSPCIRSMSNEMAERLLEFFVDCLQRIKHENRPKLKELPIYEDLSGKLRSLENAASVYLVPASLPHAGIESLVHQHSILLIKVSMRLNHLHRWLGLANKDVCSVYVEVFLPNFHHFTAAERLIHLEFLLSLWQSNEHSYHRNKTYSSIWPTLKSTPFLERSGNLSTVDRFYDPTVQVFKFMLEETKFPPRPFGSEEWLPFLRKISLIQSVSPDMFLKFANEVSQLHNNDDSLKKSQVLVEYLQRSDELRKNKSFLADLCIIPFLIADALPDDLATICSLHKRTKICFKGSLKCTDKNLKLAWTTEAILPGYTNDRYFLSELPLDDLGVMKKISCESAAKHIENISRSNVLTRAAREVMALPEGRSLKGKFKEILTLSYSFFKKNLQDGDVQSTNCLSETAFILVEDDSKVAVPKKITFATDFNLPPYLFAMSLDYGQYLGTFEILGTTKQPTIEQLVSVLSEMHAHSEGKELAPTENGQILQVTKRISDLLEDMPFPEDIDTFFLPGSYGKKDKTVHLFDAKSLIYVDDSHLDDRLDNMKQPRLTFEDAGKIALDSSKISSMISKFPKRCRPTKLSDILTEKMLVADTLPNCDFACELADKISCIEFITSVMRLIKHQLEKHSEEANKKVEELKRLLGQIIVETKAKVVTALFHNAEGRVEESEAVKGVFVEQRSGELTIYISKEQSGAERNRQYCTISSALLQFFGDLFSEAALAPHVIFLLGADPSEMHDYLNEHGIFDDNELQDYHQGRYTPGAFVPIVLHCLLKSDITDFKLGEYVAYEVEDPAINNKDGDPVFIYAIIMEKMTQSNDGSSEFYKIKTGVRESKIAHKSELYQFYRQPVADEMKMLPSTKEIDQEETTSQSLDVVKEEIRKLLQEAFRQGEEYAKKVIKRLWLKWHPDKHEVNKEFCESIFNFIQEEAERLRANARGSSGQSTYNNGQSTYSNGQSPGRSNFSSWFGNTRNRYCSRGNRYSHDRRSNRHCNYHWSGRYWVPSSGTTNPQSGEARRWFRQAKCDLDAAMKGMPSGHYEWVCFQCYQASEKALRAAVFTVDSEKAQRDPREGTLITTALLTESNDLLLLARELDTLLGNSAAMRYPNNWCYPATPHDKYTYDTANGASRLAERLLNQVERLIH